MADPDIGLVLRKTDLSGLPQVRAALAEGVRSTAGATGEARDRSGKAVLTATVSLPPMVLTGFTSSTGGSADQHLLCNASVSSLPPQPVCSTRHRRCDNSCLYRSNIRLR